MIVLLRTATILAINTHRNQMTNQQARLVLLDEQVVILLVVVPGDFAANVAVHRNGADHSSRVLTTNLVLRWERSGMNEHK